MLGRVSASETDTWPNNWREFRSAVAAVDEQCALGQLVFADRAVLPDTKTGARTIWLAMPARAILAALLRYEDCLCVLTSDDGKSVSAEKPWQVIREKAGLGRLRLFCLRHCHAALAVANQEGLLIITGLLGHANIEWTLGYAHLAEASVFEAASRADRSRGCSGSGAPQHSRPWRGRWAAIGLPPRPLPVNACAILNQVCVERRAPAWRPSTHETNMRYLHRAILPAPDTLVSLSWPPVSAPLRSLLNLAENPLMH